MSSELLGVIKITLNQHDKNLYKFFSIEKLEIGNLPNKQPEKTINFRLRNLINIDVEGNATVANPGWTNFETLSCAIFTDLRTIKIGPKDLVLAKEFLEHGTYEIFMNKALLYLKKFFSHYTLDEFRTTFTAPINDDLQRRLLNLFQKSGFTMHVLKNNPFVMLIERQAIARARSYEPGSEAEFIQPTESLASFVGLSLSQLILSQKLIAEKQELEEHLSNSIHALNSQRSLSLVLLILLGLAAIL